VKRFECGVCGAAAAFDAARCTNCATPLGYLAADRAILALDPVPDQSTAFRWRGPSGGDRDGRTFWRCLNGAWGCNWILETDSGDVWCDSCRLTRGRPDASRPDAVAAWSVAEATKRRLVDQLIALALPVARFRPDGADDLSFDFVHLPTAPGVTGHRPGRITLDLREVGDAYRESLRAGFGERERTVLGHLRHEVGHHYWRLLIEVGGIVDEFRHLFGDERADYQEALRTYYADPPSDRPDGYVSAYAAAHPLEDWAETFGRYLTVRDGLETASAFGLLGDLEPDAGFPSQLRRWAEIDSAVAEWMGSTGQRPRPATDSDRPDETSTAKLSFIHRLVAGRAGTPAPS
jgi:hypothetical protein